METTPQNDDETIMRTAGGLQEKSGAVVRFDIGAGVFGQPVREVRRPVVERVIPEASVGANRLISRRQLRAARAFAGLSQVELSLACGMNSEICRYWERPTYPGDDGWPTTNRRTLAKIVVVLEQHGVEVFCDPTPGVRMTSQRAVAR